MSRPPGQPGYRQELERTNVTRLALPPIPIMTPPAAVFSCEAAMQRRIG